MNQNNNFDDIPKEFIETMSRRLSNVGAILIGAAIIGICFAIARMDNEGIKVAIIAFSGIVGAIGIFLMIIAYVGASEMRNKHNFFLYNKKKKQDMAIGELTVSEIRNRLTAFMSSYKHRGKLYIGDLFDERQRIPEPYKTLFCYEILCEIGDERGADPAVFLSFGHECGEIFYRYLAQNGDHEIGLKIKTYILEFGEGKENVQEFKDFILAKKQYLEAKMLQFTVNNIQKFS